MNSSTIWDAIGWGVYVLANFILAHPIEVLLGVISGFFGFAGIRFLQISVSALQWVEIGGAQTLFGIVIMPAKEKSEIRELPWQRCAVAALVGMFCISAAIGIWVLYALL